MVTPSRMGVKDCVGFAGLSGGVNGLARSWSFRPGRIAGNEGSNKGERPTWLAISVSQVGRQHQDMLVGGRLPSLWPEPAVRPRHRSAPCLPGGGERDANRASRESDGYLNSARGLR